MVGEVDIVAFDQTVIGNEGQVEIQTVAGSCRAVEEKVDVRSWD